tara:strand:+ start:1795 stop:3297 length:1503 start_codon:yes stop_codon:yes gene_type:complete
MSDYLLNSSINLNDEGILVDINNIFQKKDLWTDGPFHPQKRLGWLDFEKVINFSHRNCKSILNKIHFENIIFIGMGGSIQTGKVLKQMHPNKNIFFLDTTNPLEIQKVSELINNKKNIFIVMSKSGSTIETNAVMNFFIDQMKNNNIKDFGKYFVAITDNATNLEEFAKKNNFLNIINTEENIGGRFSSSTSFGVMPYYALKKEGLKKIKISIDEISQKCRLLSGAIFYAIENDKFKKINIKVSENISEMGTWLEQLIAESSGKNNNGATPLISNLPNTKSMIKIYIDKDKNNEFDKNLLTIKFNKENIFEDMYIWQISILMLCKKINVFPFDEPDVKNSKLNTLNILKSKKNIPSLDMPFIKGNISEIFKKNLKKEMLYLNFFTAEHKDLKNSLLAFKKYLKSSKNINSISSFGPRYLHSVGQLQKGGPKNIWSIFFYDLEENKNFESINEYNELRNTFNSQILGDYFALKEESINSYLININSKNTNPFDKIIKQIKE